VSDSAPPRATPARHSGEAEPIGWYVSALEMFTIGIGPSSSHTMGPMRAATGFAQELVDRHRLPATTRVIATLYGSLAATGMGHGTPDAVVAG